MQNDRQKQATQDRLDIFYRVKNSVFSFKREHPFLDFPYFCTRFSASVSVAES